MATVWGVSHIVPSRSVVAKYGRPGDDGHNVLLMEWISEGAFLIFLGVLVTIVSAIDLQASTARAANLASATALIALACVSLLTGFRIRFLPFRLCPLIFTIAAGFIAAGTFG
jgi:hypothetical protein